VHNGASLTHGQGGDALGIVSMVNHTIAQHGADRARVYVMGFSSGGMMTNVLAGSYPEVFEAGAAYSGVAHACFLGMLLFCLDYFRGESLKMGCLKL
jgi:poly(3-hydroxybutyrate) depolymerase